VLIKKALYYQIQDGYKIPWWMGVAYRDYAMDTVVAIIWPANHIVGCLRNIWMRVRHRWTKDYVATIISAKEQSIYDRAYDIGFENGRAAEFERLLDRVEDLTGAKHN
jgi:hypothetical protein